MKIYRANLPIIVILLSMGFNSLTAQGTLQLNFQGMLMKLEQGREDQIFSSDELELVVLLKEEPSGQTIKETKYSITTDKEGWFGFEIPDFQNIFGNRTGTSEVTIQMELFPTAISRWASQGNDFMVTYTVKKVPRNDSLLFEITRIDRSILDFSQLDDVLLFTDNYPFLYLKGGFMLSVNYTEENLVGLRYAISGAEVTKSRGIKGGFAVGGYQKKDR